VYNWVDNWITPKADGESPVTVKPGHWPPVGSNRQPDDGMFNNWCNPTDMGGRFSG